MRHANVQLMKQGSDTFFPYYLVVDSETGDQLGRIMKTVSGWSWSVLRVRNPQAEQGFGVKTRHQAIVALLRASC